MPNEKGKNHSKISHIRGKNARFSSLFLPEFVFWLYVFNDRTFHTVTEYQHGFTDNLL